MIANVIAVETQHLIDCKRANFVLICGSADTGKTTLAKELSKELANVGITSNFISTDSFMLDRAESSKRGISGYNPAALN